MKKRTNKFIQIISYIILLVSTIALGAWMQRFNIEDICVDRGGGRNPSGLTVCALRENPYQQLAEQKSLIGSWDVIDDENRGSVVLYKNGSMKLIQEPSVKWEWEANASILTFTNYKKGEKKYYFYSFSGEDVFKLWECATPTCKVDTICSSKGFTYRRMGTIE